MNVTQKDIDQYVINGGDLSILKYNQIRDLSEEAIEKYIISGRDLSMLSAEQIDAASQDAINQYVENFGDLTVLSEEQINAVPYSIKDKRERDERNEEQKIHLAPPNIKAIQSASQNDINEFIVNCSNDDLKLLSNEQRANLPQYNINQYFANTGNLAGAQLLSDKQRESIPSVIMTISDNAKEGLILYTVGKMDSTHLPTDVYVNYYSREILLYIIETQTIAKYNEICKINGYIDNVPKVIVDTFEKKLEQIEKEVQEKNEAGVKKLTEKQEATINEINQLEW